MRIPSDLPPRPPRAPGRFGNRGRVILIVLFVAFVVLFLSARAISGFFVDSLWFSSLNQSDMFWGVLRTKILLVASFSISFAVLAYVSLTVADRLAPFIRSTGPEEQVLERYRDLVGHRQGLVRIVAAAIFGLIAGLPATSIWQEWLMFRHSQRFDVADPQFGVDAGFYVFKLPFLTYLVNWLFASFVIITLLTLVAHYINGGIRLQPGGRQVTSQVKLHLSALLAMLALLKAADYWLQRFALTTSQRGYVDGATYTDVKAQLPALQLLILISLLAAGLLIVNVRQRGFRLPVIAVGLWAAVAVVAGTLYPALVQRFQVEPSESTREREYIEHNIIATRAAFGLDKVDQKVITTSAVTAADVTANGAAFSDVRILDPDIVGPTFRVDEGKRTEYQFPDLDVDRYVVDDRLQQVVLAARELNPQGLPSQTWENRHLAYTHGYGLAFAPASSTDSDGRPRYIDVDGPENKLGLTKPQIYFGDGLDSYSIVGTSRTGGEATLDPARPAYDGNGGVQLSSRVRRAAFAIHFSEYNLFGSRLIDDDSRIMYNRDVRDRVSKLAPFLRLDADPYPVVVDGRIKWVIDAYTATDRYPNAERADTRQLPEGSGLRSAFNYVRNPVKAVVDAYDGSVSLYIVDESDPIIRAWRSAFPKLFIPGDQMPEELVEHLRYPEDMFRVQTNLYGRYQLTDPNAFYEQQLAWSVAQAPPSGQDGQTAAAAVTPSAAGSQPVVPTTRATDSGSNRFEPYYTLFHAPGGTEPEFVLLRPFVQFSTDDQRKELRSFMTASGDPGSYGQLTAYVIDGALPPGPLTVAAGVSQIFARELSLLDANGSQVRFGDLQLVPTGGGVLYVRPWFVLAQGDSSVPTLQSVSVSYGSTAAIGSTIGEALGKLFPGSKVDTGAGVNSPPGDAESPGTGEPSADPQTVEELLAEAERLFNEAQQAKDAFDSKTYEAKIEAAYERLREAAELATGGPITVVPSDDGQLPAEDPIGEPQDTEPPVTAST